MNEKYIEIINEMKALLLKASGSLEGEDQRTADLIDDYLKNLEYNIQKAVDNEHDCYYNDALCEGKVSYFAEQDSYLCENCIKELKNIKD